MAIKLTADELDVVVSKIQNEHRQPYYGWIRQVVTLSFGALTLLVLLQNNYIPSNPKLIWLLLTSWVLFAVSVLSGLLALYGESQIYLDTAHELSKISYKIRANNEDRYVETTHKLKPIYGIAFYAMLFCFLSATICLTLFASINLFTKGT